jgi:hypothetical protein
MYGHRCVNCGHLDIHNHGNRCCEGRCRACRLRDCQYGPSILVPTFDLAGNTQAITLPPGTRARVGIAPCGCPTCHTFYAATAGGSA